MEWDRDRLTRYRTGDPEVLAQIFQEHSGALVQRLRAAAWRGRGFERLKSAFELENVLLEVFARAFEPRARAVYDGVRPFESFLMGIARNVLLEEARSRELPMGAMGDLERQIDAALSSEPQPGAPERMEDRELEVLVEDFRERLDSDEARIYELRFVQELGQEEAAAVLGLSRIQLRRRELAMKKRLLEHLKSHGYLADLESSGWGFARRRTG